MVAQVLVHTTRVRSRVSRSRGIAPRDGIARYVGARVFFLSHLLLPILLGTIAAWYAKNLTREQATTRYAEHYHRNHRRLTHRRDGASVATEAIEAVDKVWESLLARALENKT